MRRFLRAMCLALALASPSVVGHAQNATPAASPFAACPVTTEEDNAAIVRRWHEDVISHHDLTVLDELLAPDAPHDAATFADNPGPRQVLGALLTGFPDVLHEVEAVITDGDLVVVRYRATGTHEGVFQGYAPTGKAVTWTGINIYRIACGHIAETWSEVDGLGRIAQMTGTATTASPVATPAP